MITLNKYFDKIYCINLDEATERWELCLEQFKKFDLTVERISGIKANTGNSYLLPGEIGLMRTNYNIFRKAKSLNLGSVLILEDDFVFDEDFIVKFDKAIKQVPSNWDFLYFGGNHQGGFSHISENVAKINYTFATHTFAVKNTMFDRILNILPQELKQVDVYYADMHQSTNSYVLRPHLSYQRDGFSYIQNRTTNYDFLKK